MSDEAVNTTGEKVAEPAAAPIHPLTWWVLATVFIALTAGMWWWNERWACPDETFCPQIGTAGQLRYGVDRSSVNGFGRVNKAQAWLQMEGATEREELPARAFDNDDWGDSISTTSLAIKGVSVQSIGETATMRVETDIPNRPEYVGKMGKMFYKVNGTYPEITSGDNVVDRSISGSKLGAGAGLLNYETRTSDFDYTVDVLMMPHEKPLRFWWIFPILTGLIGGFFLLAALADLLPEPKPETKAE